jgi:glutamate dehydrogenase/leucine dehydrogenase
MNTQDLDVSVLSKFVITMVMKPSAASMIRRQGLLAFIGVHNGNLGPALGGCRMYALTHQRR